MQFCDYSGFCHVTELCYIADIDPFLLIKAHQQSLLWRIARNNGFTNTNCPSAEQIGFAYFIISICVLQRCQDRGFCILAEKAKIDGAGQIAILLYKSVIEQIELLLLHFKACITALLHLGLDNFFGLITNGDHASDTGQCLSIELLPNHAAVH